MAESHLVTVALPFLVTTDLVLRIKASSKLWGRWDFHNPIIEDIGYRELEHCLLLKHAQV